MPEPAESLPDDGSASAAFIVSYERKRTPALSEVPWNYEQCFLAFMVKNLPLSVVSNPYTVLLCLLCGRLDL